MHFKKGMTDFQIPLERLGVLVVGERKYSKCLGKQKRVGTNTWQVLAQVWQAVSFAIMKIIPKGNKTCHSPIHLTFSTCPSDLSTTQPSWAQVRPEAPKASPTLAILASSLLAFNIKVTLRGWDLLWELGLASGSCQNVLSSFQGCIGTREISPILIQVNFSSHSSIWNGSNLSYLSLSLQK